MRKRELISSPYLGEQTHSYTTLTEPLALFVSMTRSISLSIPRNGTLVESTRHVHLSWCPGSSFIYLLQQNATTPRYLKAVATFHINVTHCIQPTAPSRQVSYLSFPVFPICSANVRQLNILIPLSIHPTRTCRLCRPILCMHVSW